jgi:hypothetical protein
VDFTNLKDMRRRVRLDYAQAESLMRFVDFQRKRNGDRPIGIEQFRATCGRHFCEHLSEFYSGVTFKHAGHLIISTVRNRVAGSLVERIGFVDSQIPHLRAAVGYGYNSMPVIFRADGIGLVKDDNYYDFFEHHLNLDLVERERKGDEGSINEFLQDHFHETINSRLRDPFFNRGSEEEDCELHFEIGSRTELDRLIKLFILTEPEIESHKDKEVRINAAADGDNPYLQEDDSDFYYHSERLENLADIALTENRPVGWTLKYRDGQAVNRRSGYYESPKSLCWNVGEIIDLALPRERMAGRRDVRNWLQERSRGAAQNEAPAEN